MQDYKSLCIAIMICGTLINTQIQTPFDRLLVQPAKLIVYPVLPSGECSDINNSVSRQCC